MLFCCWHVILPWNMHFRDVCKNQTKQQLKVSRCLKKLTEMRLLLIQMSPFTWAYHHRLECWGAALRLISRVPQCVTNDDLKKKKNSSDCCWVVITLPLRAACQAGGGGGWTLKATGKPKARGRTLRVSVSCWTPESPQNKLLRGGIEKQLTRYFRRGLDN